MLTFINPKDWALRTAAEGGLKSSGEGPFVQDPTETVSIRSHVVHPIYPFAAILEEPAHHYASVHYHSEPEIMIVLEGRIFINGVWAETGAVIYVDAFDQYWHCTGSCRCILALIRPNRPGIVGMGPDTLSKRAATPAQAPP
jgi:hypothetical protein